MFDQQDSVAPKERPNLKLFLLFLGTVIGGALGVFLIYFFFADKTGVLYEASNGILFSRENMELDRAQAQVLHQMIRSGAVLTPGELLSEISSFYERVITILTTLLGALGLVAYMYVKSVSEDNALKVVREAVRAQLKTPEHKKDVYERVGEIAKSRFETEFQPRIEGLESLSSELKADRDFIVDKLNDLPEVVISDLAARLFQVEKHIALLDDEEEEGSEESLSMDDDQSKQNV